MTFCRSPSLLHSAHFPQSGSQRFNRDLGAKCGRGALLGRGFGEAHRDPSEKEHRVIGTSVGPFAGSVRVSTISRAERRQTHVIGGRAVAALSSGGSCYATSLAYTSVR
jgi:hypothetical protein